MYARCDCLPEARQLFTTLRRHKDVVSFNVMLSALVQKEHGEEALQIFDSMQKEGVKSDYLTIIMLSRPVGSRVTLPPSKKDDASTTLGCLRRLKGTKCCC